MKKRSFLIGAAAVGVVGVAGGLSIPYLSKNAVPKLTIGGSIYVGWMPWYLASEDGTLARMAERYGLEIDFVRADYADSLGLFAGQGVDAVVMTNVDAASTIVASGVAADAILVGSFSNGNDALVTKADAEPELTGKTFGLVEFSVSHYLLDRLLEKNNLAFDAVKSVNISDAGMIGAFIDSSNDLDGVVSWNPIVHELVTSHGGKILGDSSAIPREIADLLVVNRSKLEEFPEFGQALLDTWFEITGRLKSAPEIAKTQLGELSGTNAAGYQLQLDKTILLGDVASAAQAMARPELKASTAPIEAFALRHALVEKKPDSWITFGASSDGVLRYNETYLANAS